MCTKPAHACLCSHPHPSLLQCPTALFDPCSCTFSDHVLCSNGRITSLNLAFQNLPGPFPTSLLNLTGLTGLSLYGNQLNGTVPTSLGKLTGLTELSLDTNQLSGTVPASLGQLTGLTILYLGYNQLSGTVPASLGQLTGLTYLRLAGNQLSGTVPTSLAKLTGLTYLRLNDNPALGGKLPALNFAQYTSCCALAGDNFSCPLPPGAASCRGGTYCVTQPPPTCH